jgi:hypothetical protein
MKTQVDTTQRKKNSKKKSNKDPMQRIHGYKMIINNNKENLR